MRAHESASLVNALELVLAQPSALRVLDTRRSSSWQRMCAKTSPNLVWSGWIREAVAANRLRRVVRGLFLNRLITPPPQLCEAAVCYGRAR